MAYIVSNDFKQKLYDGECDFDTTLIINGNTIPQEQISSISISSPIVDDSNETFYLGTFISQKLTIKFNNLDGLSLESGQEVSLSISQDVNGTTESVPIGLFLVDDLGENYQQTCEITCMDYGVKFKPNIDYSPCFVDGKATIDTILAYICNYFGVTLGDYPTINGDIEIGTYDSTISGKQWISYIAEIKGCNAKIDRQGRLTLQPLKQASSVSIDASQSASFELGEKYNITKIVYTDAIRNYTYGTDSGNTLFIRQDNPFITKEIMDNLYQNVFAKTTNSNIVSDGFNVISPTIKAPIKINFLKGETMQNGNPNPNNPIPIKVVGGNSIFNISQGSNSQSYELKLPVKNLWASIPTQTQSLIDLTNNGDGSYTIDGYSYSNSIMFTELVDLPIGEYTLSANNPTIDTKVRLRLDLENGTNKVLALSQANQSATYNLTSKIVSISIWIVNSPDLTNFYIKPELTLEGLEPIELNKIGTYQDYIYKDSGNWYLHKVIGKVVLDGSESWEEQSVLSSTGKIRMRLNNILQSIPTLQATTPLMLSNLYSPITADYMWTAHEGIGISVTGTTLFVFDNNYNSSGSLSGFKTFLSTNNLIVYYVLNTPTETEITNETLLSNLNALEEAYTYDGSTTIRNTPSSSDYFAPTYDINVYMRERYIFYSLKTRNYGDFTLDAWDNIDYELDGNTYKTLNNNIIKIEGSIMGDYETKIPTKQQTITTNVVEENIKSVKKFAKTEIDNANAQISLKVGKDEVINSINLSTEGATIDAEKISLNGKTINLTSDTIDIKSNNFDVDTEGNLTCNEATMKGATFTGGDVTLYQDPNDQYDYPLQIYEYETISSLTLNESYNLYNLIFNYPNSGFICTVVQQTLTPFLKLENDDIEITYNHNYYTSWTQVSGEVTWELITENTRDKSTNKTTSKGLWQSRDGVVKFAKQPSIIEQTLECTLYDTTYSAIFNIIRYVLTTTNGLTKLNANTIATKDIFLRDETQQYYFNGGGTSGTINTNMLINNLSGGFRVTNDASFYDSNYRNLLSNEVLWSGAWYMNNTQTASLSSNVSDQPHGIVLVWSAYTSSGGSQNYNWHCDFVPKEAVALANSLGGNGFCFQMASSKFGNIATKYVYISDNQIKGNNDNTASGTSNGITYANSNYVLRYVIGV